MESRSGTKLQVLVWLLALWLSVAAAGKGGGGGGRGFGGHVIVPPVAPPIPTPNIHVNPVPVPVKPCYPVTKEVTEFKLLDNHVPVYQTQVQPVIVTTTLFQTSYITKALVATSLLVTTVHTTKFKYDSSVAYITHIETVTTVESVPVVTTVTKIGLTVEPQVTTVSRIVTEGVPKYLTNTAKVTHTVYNQPRVTYTEQFPFPYDSFIHQQVTETKYVTETVVAKQGPRLTSTVVRTQLSYTPSYTVVTVTDTVPFTTTVTQHLPQTVTVKSPCGGGGGGGIGKGGNSYGIY